MLKINPTINSPNITLKATGSLSEDDNNVDLTPPPGEPPEDHSLNPELLSVPYSAPYYVKALDSGRVWSNDGNGVTITYKFWDSLPSYYSSGSTEANNFQVFTSAQRAATEKILDMLENVANITFVEVSSDSAAQMGFAQANLGSGIGAWAYYPGTSGKSGDVWMNNAYSATKTVTEGTYGFMVLAHEIGHAMGLSHPFDQSPTLPGAEDSSRYTIMSYTWPFYSESFMMYDIAALQAKYGANTSYNSGNTTYTLDYGAAYTIWDGGGTDTLDGSSISSAITLNLNEGTLSSVGKTQNIGIAYNTTIENAKGGNGSDTIYGNDASNRIWGNGGNDKIYASAGNDTIDGGSGTDTVIYSYNISEFLINLVDSVTATLSHALLGLDTLINIEKFIFNGLTVNFSDLSDYTSGGTGGSGGNDNGDNTDDNDDNTDNGSGTINGSDSADTLTGTSGDDIVYGYGGYDKLYGYDGNDTLYGGAYYDRLYGHDGNDTLNGEDGNDYLYGGNGNDTLDGGDGNDRIYGNNGDDIIKGSAGNDYLYGDSGTDTVVYDYDITDFLINVIGSTYVKVTHNTLGTDTLRYVENFQFKDTTYSLSELQDYLAGNTGDNTDDTDNGDTGGGNDGTDDNNTDDGTDNNTDGVIKGSDGYDTLHGTSGDDTIYGYGAYDKLYGKDGDDTLYGGDYFDKLYGDNGNDTLYGENGSDYLYGGAGNDILEGGVDNDYLYGGSGNDVLSGGDGSDRLYGDEGNDTLNGNDGNDMLYGRDGDDKLVGGKGNDYLYGDDGNDILVAGLGRDLLYGKSGSDTFAFDAIDNNVDLIRDFTLQGPEADKLNITDILSGFDGSSDINDFVRLNTLSSSRTELSINQDGTGDDWVTVASISGSNFSGTTVEDLMSNGQLITGESLL